MPPGITGLAPLPADDGVLGTSGTGSGVEGFSDSGDGVRAVSASGNTLSAFGGGDLGVAIFAQESAKRNPVAGKNSTAGFFDGNVVVNGDIQITGGGDIRLADLAEDFDISGIEEIEPGSVVVLDDEGSVQQSRAAYDHRLRALSQARATSDRQSLWTGANRRVRE